MTPKTQYATAENVAGLTDAQVNRLRVWNYLRLCQRNGVKRAKEAARAADAIARAETERSRKLAREKGAKALRLANFYLSQAELTAKVLAAGDPEWDAEVAAALEELIG